ncbi:uncharacterized protein VTP21DRAFT_3454 [Calcarisporiella thermophila]|uniref:uncharacterized protein n=1 Tax=Calcarisporiella thermophila TaxID=911321 RepID=UPI003744AAEC
MYEEDYQSDLLRQYEDELYKSDSEQSNISEVDSEVEDKLLSRLNYSSKPLSVSISSSGASAYATPKSDSPEPPHVQSCSPKSCTDIKNNEMPGLAAETVQPGASSMSIAMDENMQIPHSNTLVTSLKDNAVNGTPYIDQNQAIASPAFPLRTQVIDIDEEPTPDNSEAERSGNEFDDNVEFGRKRRSIRYYVTPEDEKFRKAKVCFTCGGEGHDSLECTLCKRCGASGHNVKNCPYSARTCYRCLRRGHESADCPEDRRSSKCARCGSYQHHSDECHYIWRDYTFTPTETPTEPVVRWCYNCAQSGHYGDHCPDSSRFMYRSDVTIVTAFSEENLMRSGRYTKEVDRKASTQRIEIRLNHRSGRNDASNMEYLRQNYVPEKNRGAKRSPQYEDRSPVHKRRRRWDGISSSGEEDSESDRIERRSASKSAKRRENNRERWDRKRWEKEHEQGESKHSNEKRKKRKRERSDEKRRVEKRLGRAPPNPIHFPRGSNRLEDQMGRAEERGSAARPMYRGGYSRR